MSVRGSDAIVVGRFVGTVDFDPGPGEVKFTSGGGTDGTDVCVSKFNTDGEFQWVLVWGNEHDALGRGAAIDQDGNVYVSAEFQGTVDFDPDPGGSEFRSSNGYRDLSLSKFDSYGNFIWVRTFGGSGHDRPGLVDVDKYGNPYMVAYFRGTNVNFAPSYPPCDNSPETRTASGECDSVIVKHLAGGCW